MNAKCLLLATAASIVCLSPSNAYAQRASSPADARVATQALHTLALALDSIAESAPGTVVLDVGVVAKEDNDEDQTDQTISCSGDTQVEADWCEAVIGQIVEMTDEPEAWVCESIQNGTSCTHQPH